MPRKVLASYTPHPCLNPTPYTLHPTPYTPHPCLHPTPYTLHPTPYTPHPCLHPTPCTLYPTPYTLHPTPDTRHPSPFLGPVVFCQSQPPQKTVNLRRVGASGGTRRARGERDRVRVLRSTLRGAAYRRVLRTTRTQFAPLGSG